MPDTHNRITLHRVKFPQPVVALERTFDPVQGADCWRFCVGHSLGDHEMPTLKSATWAGLGIWNTRKEAEAMMQDPVAAMAALAEADEVWHALAVPIRHRGEARWRGHLASNNAIKPCAEDPSGPLAVITAASFDDPTNPDELARMSRFAVKVSEAITFMA